MKDCVVIGCGIIGGTIALALRKQGLDVDIIDANLPMAGTKPSGGHLKPSWFGSLPKAEYEPAMQLLDDVWGVKVEEFIITSLGLAKTKVYRVDTDLVTTTGHTVGLVTQVHKEEKYPTVVYKTNKGVQQVRTRLLIVATGVWAQELLEEEVQAKQGVSFRMKGKLRSPFIFPWAPYKQIVAHQQTEESIWIGDGSAILSKNWNEKRTKDCLARCNNALGKKLASYRTNPPTPLATTIGLRAYCHHPKTEPCLFKKVGPSTFVITGAGKSGTISAGWAANRILKHAGC